MFTGLLASCWTNSLVVTDLRCLNPHVTSHSSSCSRINAVDGVCPWFPWRQGVILSVWVGRRLNVQQYYPLLRGLICNLSSSWWETLGGVKSCPGGARHLDGIRDWTVVLPDYKSDSAKQINSLDTRWYWCMYLLMKNDKIFRVFMSHQGSSSTEKLNQFLK